MKKYFLTFIVVAAGVGGLGVAGTKILVKYSARFHQYIDKKTLDDSDEVEAEILLRRERSTSSYNNHTANRLNN